LGDLAESGNAPSNKPGIWEEEEKNMFLIGIWVAPFLSVDNVFDDLIARNSPPPKKKNIIFVSFLLN
jgi:hypothetical protein